MPMKFIEKKQAPMWFTILGIIALVWNLLGVGAYLIHVYMTDEMISELPQAQIDIIYNTPVWVNGAFALAVWCGLLGSICMLFKKKISVYLFQISFAGIFIQNIHSFFMIDAVGVFGLVQGLIMPSIVMFFAIVLILVNTTAKKSHWIR